MSNKWMPSNGSEEQEFVDSYCSHCRHETWNPKTGKGRECKILTASFLKGSVPEWQVSADGTPRCINFERHRFVNKGGRYRYLEKRVQLKLEL